MSIPLKDDKPLISFSEYIKMFNINIDFPHKLIVLKYIIINNLFYVYIYSSRYGYFSKTSSYFSQNK